MPRGIPKSGKRQSKKGKEPAKEIIRPVAHIEAKMPILPSTSARPADGAGTSKTPATPKQAAPKKDFKLSEEGYFGPRITVQDKAKEKHLSQYFPDGHLSMILVGRSSCGKSTILREIIPQIANLSQVIVLTRVIGNPVFDGVREYCENTINKKTISEENPDGLPIQFGIAYNEEDAEELIESFVGSKPPDTAGFIIFDDFTNLNSSRSDGLNRIQNTVYSMLRNYGYHNACLTQNPTNVPTLSRANATMRFLFAINEIHGVISIRRDWVGLTGRSANDFDDLYRRVKNTDHGFLVVNTAGKDNRVFICLPGETEGVEWVDFEDGKISTEKLQDDSRLKALVDGVDVAKESKSALRRRYIERAEKALSDYIDYLAKSSGIDTETIRDLVYKIYDL